MPRRPRLPRPKLRRPSRPKLPNDLWFRFVTRLRAARYWIREKAQHASRSLKKAAEWVVDQWAQRSHETRMRILAVAGVFALYLFLKFVPVPGVPCQVSAAKECAPPDDSIAFVPADALLYAHFTADRDSHQYELAKDYSEELPDITQLVREATSALPTPTGTPVDLGHDVFPWAKDDVSLTLLPGPKGTLLPVFIVGVGDKDAADQFLAGIAPPDQAQPSDQNGSALSVYPAGFATAFSGDELLFGADPAVRAALDAKSGKADGLEGSDQDAAREELPDVRFAEIYFSQAGVQRLLAGRGGASQLETFVDFGATTGVAASATAKDDGIEVDLVSKLDKKLLAASPTFFSELPEFEPDLADEASERSLAYIGVGEVGPTVANVLANAGAQSQGLAGSLRALAASLQQQAGVDPLQDLLPALGGQAALVAEPTDIAPYASLIVDGVDEDKAKEALARLQGPIVKSLGTQAGAQASFKESEVEGVTVNSVQVSPAINLSYALFDGKLVISTDPAGIAQVRSQGGELADSSNYQRVTDRLPDKLSALIFLNLDEFLDLAEERLSLAEDALYASLADDISNIPSLGIGVRGTEEQIRSELFLEIQ